MNFINIKSYFTTLGRQGLSCLPWRAATVYNSFQVLGKKLKVFVRVDSVFINQLELNCVFWHLEVSEHVYHSLSLRICICLGQESNGYLKLHKADSHIRLCNVVLLAYTTTTLKVHMWETLDCKVFFFFFQNSHAVPILSRHVK